MAINPLFNAKFYLAHNEDLVRAGLHTDEQLWNHYVEYGAQESKNVVTRAPNAWFDVNYYLAAYPDLLANGITAATALDHFLTYGISENREFSATLSLSQFTAAKYASENKDLRKAFDIADDFTELTAEQKTALITHYLSYGYKEDRKGAGTQFEKVVTAKNEITVTPQKSATGTIVDDEFTVAGNAGAAPDDNVIDGLGGNDTVKFTAASTGYILKNIEEVVVNTGAVAFTSAQLLNKITLDTATTAVTASFANNLVSGSADVLNVVSKATAGVVTVNGFETVNLTANGAATTINANAAKGASLTVNVDGGKAGVAGTVKVDSENSPSIETVTINASANAGDLALVAGTTLKAVKNIVMEGGAGKNVFTNSSTGDVKTNFTVKGGAGKDTLNASAAIDTFTGGAGDDTFKFATDSALIRTKTVDGKVVVDAVDTIVDFKAGTNTLELTGVAKLTVVDTTGLIPAGTQLEDLLAAKDSAGAAVIGANSIFDFKGDAYIVLGNDVTDLAKAQVIKLAGVQTTDFKVVGTAIAETTVGGGDYLLLA